MSMQQMLRESALFYRGNPAIVEDGGVLTYQQLRERVLRLTNALRGLGLRQGDRLAMLSLTSGRYYEWYFGCCEGGFIGVPLNVRLRPEEIIEYLNYTTPRAIIVDTRLQDLAGAVVPHVPSLERVIGYGEGHACPLDFETLLAGAPADELPEVDPHLPAIIASTSGTTGIVKGAMISQANTYAGVLAWLGGYRLSARSRWLQSLPMYFGQGGPGYYMPFMAGASIHIVPAFDPHQCAEVCERERITHTIWPPAMIYQILDAGIRGEKFRTLQVIGSGGSPFDPTRFRAATKLFGPKIYATFGLTEATVSATQLKPEDYLDDDGEFIGERYTSIGKPWPSVVMRVVREDGTPVARDGEEIGEIVLAGPGISLGYWQMPGETATTFVNGWLYTGDLATMDDDGFAYIVDRRKDIIVSGGINVPSLEVEKAIGTHPAVAGVAVIGVPHEKWGEAIHACVVRTPGAEVSEAEIIGWCKQRLASYKKPQSVEFIDALPISSTGKVLKRDLREKHWAGRDRRVS